TLVLYEEDGSVLKPVHRVSLPTRGFPTLQALLGDFQKLAQQDGVNLAQGDVKAAAFGVAAAIIGGRALSNNLPWPVDCQSVAATLGLRSERMLLLNDLVAAASSLAYLKPADLMQLNDTIAEDRAPKALIAAGTGLGEAI